MLEILISKNKKREYLFSDIIGKDFYIQENDALTTWDSVYFYEWNKKTNVLKMALKKGDEIIQTVSLVTTDDFDKTMEYKYNIKFVESTEDTDDVLSNKTQQELEDIRSGITLLVNKGYERIKDVSLEEREAFLVLYSTDLNEFPEEKELISIIKESYD